MALGSPERRALLGGARQAPVGPPTARCRPWVMALIALGVAAPLSVAIGIYVGDACPKHFVNTRSQLTAPTPTHHWVHSSIQRLIVVANTSIRPSHASLDVNLIPSSVVTFVARGEGAAPQCTHMQSVCLHTRASKRFLHGTACDSCSLVEASLSDKMTLRSWSVC